MPVKAFMIYIKLCVVTLLLASCTNSELKVTSDKSQNSEVSQQNTPSISMDNPESYEMMLKTDSLNLDMRLKLAGTYYTTKNFDKALYHYLIVNSIDKKNMAALFNLGNVYYDTQQDELAIKYYEKFLELDKNNSNVRCDLATCYMNLKNTGKAISLLRENIKLDNNHLQSHHNLSVILKQAGKTAEADEEMKIYNTLLESQPGMTQ
jgi:tetratricopeptide (TPR) repeat protein